MTTQMFLAKKQLKIATFLNVAYRKSKDVFDNFAMKYIFIVFIYKNQILLFLIKKTYYYIVYIKLNY